MRYLLIATGTATLVSASAAASQAITTFGSTTAQTCYEAARDGRASQSALSVCNQALKDVLSSSDLVATLVNRGIIHALRKDYLKALLDYDRAIALDPNEAEALLNKGLLLLHRPNRDDEALKLISLAIEKKTTMPALAYFARGVVHERLGQASAAYRDYQQAAALDPEWNVPVRELRRFRKKS